MVRVAHIKNGKIVNVSKAESLGKDEIECPKSFGPGDTYDVVGRRFGKAPPVVVEPAPLKVEFDGAKTTAELKAVLAKAFPHLF